MSKLRKAWAISGREWILVVKSAGLLLAVHGALRLMSFKTLLAWIRRSARLKRQSVSDPRRMAYLVEVAARYHPLRPNCLDKSLVLYGLLKRRGIDAEFAIGTLKKNGTLEAHAWVEYEGAIILGQTSNGYVPLCSSAEIPPL